jgi:uncharacterized protein involved in outer membrane biogenesis
MKKFKKLLLIAVMLLLLIVIIAALVVAASLDRIVKAGIETVAPRMTQTTVTLDGVSLSLLTGSAAIHNLVIGNPSGYQSPEAIRVAKAAVSIAPFSLLSDKIVVRSVVVHGPEITFEGNPFGANNLKKILDNLNGPASAASAESATVAEKKPARKLEVDDFLLTGAKVHVQFTGFINQRLELPLPDVHLTGLGQGSDGITAVDLTRQVLSQVINSTIKAVAQAAGNLGKNAANAGVKQIKKGLSGFFGK